jgi:hypothetical protein
MRLALPTALGGLALGILAVDAIGLSPVPLLARSQRSSRWPREPAAWPSSVLR